MQQMKNSIESTQQQIKVMTEHINKLESIINKGDKDERKPRKSADDTK